MTPTCRSGIAAVEASSRVMFCRTERARKKALMAAQPMISTVPNTQPRGVNHTRISTTKASAIAIRMKNERKRPRFTRVPYV
jgi:hypothetical protein